MDMQNIQNFVSTTVTELAIKVLAAIAFWIVGRWLIGRWRHAPLLGPRHHLLVVLGLVGAAFVQPGHRAHAVAVLGAFLRRHEGPAGSHVGSGTGQAATAAPTTPGTAARLCGGQAAGQRGQQGHQCNAIQRCHGMLLSVVSVQLPFSTAELTMASNSAWLMYCGT